MTVKEAISSYPGMVDISDSTVERIMQDRSVNGAVVYNSDRKKDVELCVADCLVAQIVNPDFSEGDLSVKYSKSAMFSQAKAIYLKYEETEKLKEISRLRATPKIIHRQW